LAEFPQGKKRRGRKQAISLNFEGGEGGGEWCRIRSKNLAIIGWKGK